MASSGQEYLYLVFELCEGLDLPLASRKVTLRGLRLETIRRSRTGRQA